MSWFILEGLDRTGKSTVSELYKKRGFEVVHMSAPSKKYREPGYSGPSYLDDLLDLIMKCDGKDVIFDRSHYGELVWPYVYGRDPMLTEDDLEILQEFEDRNETKKILMIDPDVASHWKRCVENKEPMDQSQFRMASALFNKMAHKYNFMPKQLRDFEGETKTDKQTSAINQQVQPESVGQDKNTISVTLTGNSNESASTIIQVSAEDELAKLERANAIRDVLDKRILKSKGGTFDKLEEEIRGFLKTQLSNIFKADAKEHLTSEEIIVLKTFCQRLKEKSKEQK